MVEAHLRLAGRLFLVYLLQHLRHATKSRGGLRLLLLVAFVAIVFASSQLLPAAVVVDPDGIGATDVDPTDPTAWTSSTTAYVGKSALGVLLVDGGSQIDAGYGYIGNASGATGTVTVDGIGSIWTNSSKLYVGCYGGGTLEIANGGLVTVTGTTHVAYLPGSQGTIRFNDGTLDTRSLFASDANLTGTGTILLHGVIADDTLVLDSLDDLTGYYRTIHGLPNQNITVNLNIDGQGSLGAGHLGTGSLTVSHGLTVASTTGYIGYNSGSNGTVMVDDTGSTWRNNGYLYVGYDGNGTLAITNGGVVNNSFYGIIGYEFGSTGTVTVDGTASTWTNRSNTYVGYDGSGTLEITGGGAVSSGSGSYDSSCIGYDSGSTGTVTVDGTSSTWANSSDLCVGRYGRGTLEITGGGLVTVTGTTHVAYGSGSHGTITFNNGTLDTGTLLASDADLTGTGTILLHGVIADDTLVLDSPDDLAQHYLVNGLPNQNITVNLNIDGQGSLGAGHLGTGSLTVSHGLTVASTTGYIGYNSGSNGTVVVDDTGSTWSNSTVYVGLYGSGTLEITNGGAVSSSNYCLIGFGSSSTGTVIVDGTGSTWTNSAYLYVGVSGSGTMEITNGGTVSTSYGAIGYSLSATGTVTVDDMGSAWTNSSSMHVGDICDGTLKITNGGTVSNVIGVIGSESGSTGIVTAEGTGSTWTNSSDLYVGRYGRGTLEITCDGLVSVGGKLTIDYNTNGDSFINMAAGSMLALLGDADDSLAAFLNLISGTDAIRYWNESTSSWSAITGAVFGDDYTLSYFTEGDLAGYTVLTVLTTTVPADANWDGVVNELDAAVLASHWGQTGGWSDGDFDHDGIINAADASILAANWGHGTGESTAVPEPSVLVMMVGLASLLLGRRRLFC